jgi:Mg-chelatase subunit ChlD
MNTEILFVVDRSGSMASLNAAACAGFNSFLDEQRTVGGNARVSLTYFNQAVAHAYTAIPINSVGALYSIEPSGMTAMYDGIGEAINLHSSRIEREKWADSTIMVIITDGAENSSRRFTQSATAQMISMAKSIGWQFIFMGANIDVGQVASKLNIDRELAYEFNATAEGVRSVYAQASATTKAMRSWGL